MARSRTQPPASKSGLFPHVLLCAVLVWSCFRDYTQVYTVGCLWKQIHLGEQSRSVGCSGLFWIFSIIAAKKGSDAYKFWKESKPNTLICMSTSIFFQGLKASATRFSVPALCSMTKVNCCKYAAQDACRDEILSWLPICLRASWSVNKTNSWRNR
jgi:hypothetical protein